VRSICQRTRACTTPALGFDDFLVVVAKGVRCYFTEEPKWDGQKTRHGFGLHRPQPAGRHGRQPRQHYLQDRTGCKPPRTKTRAPVLSRTLAEAQPAGIVKGACPRVSVAASSRGPGSRSRRAIKDLSSNFDHAHRS
jgi:hypothetical protein